jgi:hypothetical protein
MEFLIFHPSIKIVMMLLPTASMVLLAYFYGSTNYQ